MNQGLFAAWWLMFFGGWKNRIRRQLSRLRKPRYLAATLVGGAYFVWLFGLQRRSFQTDGAAPDDFRDAMELLFIAFGLLAVLLAWVFGSDRAALNFAESEVQFFFPAPYSRRQLLRFKLLRGLGRTVISAAITTLFIGRGLQHPGFFFVGAFLGLATLSFHVTGASFLREALLSFGWSGVFRRIFPIALFALLVGGTLLFTWQSAAFPDFSSASTVLRWARALVETKPLSWLLFPIRATVRVAVATDLSTFLRALPAALAVLAVHYFWVERSDISFEEASLRAAERRAKWVDARRGSAATAAPSGEARSWRLSAKGLPEVAIFWKNLIAARRVYSLRVLPSLLLLAGALAASSLFLVPRKGGGMTFAVGFFCAIAAVILVVIGPSAARIDLRQDLPAIDVLRAWPLSGFQVMRAEVFGAAAVLGSLQWLLLLAAFGFTLGAQLPGIGMSERLAVLLTLALLCPSLSLAGLVVQNAAALLFPSWVTPEVSQQRGVEVLGQRMLTLAGTWIVLLVAIVPIGAVGAAFAFVLFPLLGFWAGPVGAVVIAGALTAAATAATYAMGRLFERFDPSE